MLTYLFVPIRTVRHGEEKKQKHIVMSHTLRKTEYIISMSRSLSCRGGGGKVGGDSII